MKKKIVMILIVIAAATTMARGDDCGVIVENPRSAAFALVVDRSGSMAGEALEKARLGVLYFMREMQAGDRAALIAFGDNVDVIEGLTSSKERLYRVWESFPGASGSTRFHDAVGSAAKMLAGVKGDRAIVFLTDGNDNKSDFTLSDIRQMTIGEGIFVYGVGVGNIDHDGFERLSKASGGVYRIARTSDLILTLYTDVHRTYYDRIESNTDSSGTFSIVSRPQYRNVRIDGANVGRTPVVIDEVDTGFHRIEVDFQKGVWECSTEIKGSSTTYVVARESEVPVDLVIETAPARAAVFIDDVYAGFSSITPVFGTSWDGQLRIPAVKPGRHTIRVVAVPDFDLGESFTFEFDFTMGNETRYVSVSVFFRTAEFLDGETIRGGFSLP